ncbi:leucine-, isoleucine-, valine-, threonine-, and alanine-binding protein precursor [Peptococcaceae bacterium CEB3]|nr:leucine-, isoleucine-, valine-, threonine-, and alanine-binding protein precursor [Peptococcaceae bacterium CEB3]
MSKLLRKRHIATLIAVITAFGLFLGGCGSGGGSSTSGSSGSGTLDIGWVAPLTGSSANDGQQMLNGAKLAAKEINDTGGIDGKKIKIVAQDDKADPKEAANIANMFAGNKNLVAVLGNYNSSCGLAGAPVYDQAKLPMIHVGTSPVFSEQNHPYVFRISVTDAFQGSFVTQWMYDEGHKNVAIIYENDDYGRGLKDTVSSEMRKLGGKVAGTWSYMLGQTRDYTAILTDVKNSGADAIFIGGLYTEGALIGKQMQGLGIKLPVYGTDGLYEESLIKLGGSAVNGWKVSGLFLPTENDPKLQKFIKNYQAAYKSTPGTYAALDFDAMNLLAKVIKTVGTSHEKIQAYLVKMPGPFEGVTGNITFNDHHDAVRKTLKKLVVKNGEWQLFQK